MKTISGFKICVGTPYLIYVTSVSISMGNIQIGY